jgi:hypothetical protein
MAEMVLYETGKPLFSSISRAFSKLIANASKRWKDAEPIGQYQLRTLAFDDLGYHRFRDGRGLEG